MLYTKKSDEKYTDLCEEFDENFFTDKRDDEKCYRTMYLVYYMLACKARYFRRFEDYDSYAQFAVNTIYMRFLKKYKNGETNKSLLNYAKKTIYPLKVMFLNDDFSDTASLDYYDGTFHKEDVSVQYKDAIQRQYEVGMEDDIYDTIDEIPQIVKDIISETPYCNDKVMCKKLFTSCMLTLAKRFTLCEESKEKLVEAKAKKEDITLIKIYNNERNTSLTLWGLDETYSQYVLTLVNKAIKEVVKDICNTKNSFTIDGNIMDSILMSAYEVKTDMIGEDE